MDAPVNDQVLAQLYAAHARPVRAALVRLLGDLDLAEEATHDAFEAAATRWARDGVPANPRAWLISTGRFKGIDTLRRRGRGEAILRDLAAGTAANDGAVAPPEDALPDDQLRLVFTCCHPALEPDARVALCLREVCGLRTEEVARAFLVTPAAMKKRITRAKATIRDRGIPYEIPGSAELPERLAAVLRVVYLVYNEGFAATAGEHHIRRELTREALYLAALIVEVIPDPEALGLHALLLLHESRAAARVDEAGDIVPLQEQDRSQWDASRITEAQLLLQRALLSGRVGPYTLQAAIASVHASAASVEQTRWDLIVDYDDALATLTPGPVVQLQRAVAIAMRDGPAAGLALVEPLVAGPMSRHHSAHAVVADLARRLCRWETARDACDRALALARQEPERRYLRRLREKIEKKVPAHVPEASPRSTSP